MQHNNWSTLTDHLVQRVTRCRGSINSYLVHPRRHISFHTVLLIHEFYYSPLINILYTADIVVLSMLLYGSETWPTTMVNRKKPDAAHNKWLKRILHISWRDKIRNKAVLERTGQEDMGNIIRRLRWMGHVARMEGERRAIQARGEA